MIYLISTTFIGGKTSLTGTELIGKIQELIQGFSIYLLNKTKHYVVKVIENYPWLLVSIQEWFAILIIPRPQTFRLQKAEYQTFLLK